jgi:xylulokinase
VSEVFIGVDSGTQGTKAVAIQGATGAILAEHSVSYGLIKGLPEAAREQHPKTWVQAMEKCLKTLLASTKVKASGVKGIGISGQQHGLVVLNDQGKVIRPAKLWCDTATAGQAESLIRKLGGLKKVIGLTGNGIPPGFTASKIAWLKEKESKNYAATKTILLPHDYLNYHLTGVASMEAGDASGTGFFDTKTRDWSAPVIKAIDPGLADKLPPIQEADAPVGTLAPMLAKRLGLDPETIVSAGGGDNMMGAIGTGNTKSGIITASLGTSATLYAYSTRPVIDPEGEIAAFCDSTGGWLPLICTMNGTIPTECVKALFKWTNNELTKQAEKVSPGCDGLILLPYFQGERVPNIPAGRAVYFGLTPDNMTPAHMARAAMEGAAMGLNYGLERLRDMGVRPKEIRLTGGGSANPVWRQILADVFDTDVICLKTTEGAAYGAAIQAVWCWKRQRGENIRIQHITDKWVKVDTATRARPRKKEVKQYRALQTVYDSLSRSSTPVFDQLASVA